MLWLSWNSMLLWILHPCASRKYRVYRIGHIKSSTEYISLSVELLPFCFWRRDLLIIAPSPKDIIPPLCPLQSSWTANAASTHHLITCRLFAFRVKLAPRVPYRYFRTLFNFPQSSSSGSFTLLQRNETGVWISLLTYPS